MKDFILQANGAAHFLVSDSELSNLCPQHFDEVVGDCLVNENDVLKFGLTKEKVSDAVRARFTFQGAPFSCARKSVATVSALNRVHAPSCARAVSVNVGGFRCIVGNGGAVPRIPKPSGSRANHLKRSVVSGASRLFPMCRIKLPARGQRSRR
jgi:hypothetical protein